MGIRSGLEIRRAAVIGCIGWIGLAWASGLAPAGPAPAPTILFVTQPPFPGNFATINTVFGNHLAYTPAVPRGGDLYIRYGNGTLRNLTAEAGFGLEPGKEIAVREPSVHFTAKKALFSMVVGGATKDVFTPVFWQIYEVSGLEPGGKAVIVKLPQPDKSNNVSPLYGTDERVIFTSDLPRNRNAASSPQLDEYESVPTNTGIWSMKRDGTDIRILDHAISGAFTPILASDGRVIFSRWDHLVRDQQNNDGTEGFGAFNYASETSTAALPTNIESFPEPLGASQGGYMLGHKFNHFFPWEMNEDGSALETLNHVGRHELLNYFQPSHLGLPYFYEPQRKAINGLLLQIKESPTEPGRFFGTTAPEFYTHGSGQIVSILAGPQVNPDDMEVEYITDPITVSPTPTGQAAPPNHPGRFRNPLPLTDGSLVAVRTSSPYVNQATGGPLGSSYDFHLSKLEKNGDYFAPAARLIPGGIQKSISYWDNYTYSPVSWSGTLWELDPVEVTARKKPKKRVTPLPAMEQQILKEELGSAGVKRLQGYLRANQLALVISRDVTRRADKQQDFNLKIAGSSTQTAMPGSTPVEIGFLQFFQGDLIRGYTAYQQGRRPIAVPMHDGVLPKVSGAPKGSVALGADGSMAAIVPAGRALSWQLTKTDGEPVVRERYWVTFAAGEMRVCANCHGINKGDVVLGEPSPTNPPQALRDLLTWYKNATANGTTGDTVGAYAPSASSLALTQSHAAGQASVNWQEPGTEPSWLPIAGDWDGDGIDSIGFYDPATSTFHLRNEFGAGVDDLTFTFGTANPALRPIAGDWDGEGTDTIGLYSTTTGVFLLRNSNSSGPADHTFSFGPLGGAVPVAGNWDGVGSDSVGVYVASTGQWLLRNENSAGAAHVSFVFTLKSPNAVPLAGDWDANGTDTPGFYEPATGVFTLRKTSSKSGAKITVKLGVPNAIPVAGDWNGG
ncbi:MAG: hypothetical protein JNJ88_14175 [Planctomycetes bacterium]|nr:hypothetical protein [Planctomycetota bacterium]